jgi:hypothetical protein
MFATKSIRLRQDFGGQAPAHRGIFLTADCADYTEKIAAFSTGTSLNILLS